MTFQQLTYAVTAAEFGSINQAAEYLYTNQSNISNAIRHLEDEFGIQIFSRTSKGVYTTKAGREFLQYAQELLGKKDAMEKIYKLRNKNQPQHFTISSMRSFFAYAPLIQLQKKIRWESPMILRLRKCAMREVLESVSERTADLGIIYVMRSKQFRVEQIARLKNVCIEEFGESQLHIIVREDHPLAGESDLHTIMQYPYVVVEGREENGWLYDEESEYVSNFFRAIPKIIFSTNDSMACQSIVANTDAFFISTTPWKHNLHYKFKSIPLPGEENRLTYYTVTQKGQAPTHFMGMFIEKLHGLLP